MFDMSYALYPDLADEVERWRYKGAACRYFSLVVAYCGLDLLLKRSSIVWNSLFGDFF